jgi:pyruvate formate lyase activating enzyme
MLIGGLQKTTLIDYPGVIACTVFMVGCNYRCPFCHNRDLVLSANFKKSGLREYSQNEILEFLDKRKQFLDGVCLTGGEPTLNPDLPEFISQIKQLGYKVKLDTNGSFPDRLQTLYDKRLLDYVAMDIKTAFSDYEKAVKVTSGRFQVLVKKSIKLILQSGIPFEFRTTVVPGLHNAEIVSRMVKDLAGEIEKANQGNKNSSKVGEIKYFLQNFRPQNCLDSRFLKLKPFNKQELLVMLAAARQYLPLTKVRGEEDW